MSKAAVKTALENISPPVLPEEVQTKPSSEEIINVETLAYQLWEERGCPESDPEADWYEAEFQVKMRNVRPPTE